MVHFASLALALTAAISGASAAVAAAAPHFSHPCTFPYDVCGWTLADGDPKKFNYDPAVLEAAAKAAGQTVNPNDKTIVYDAIYNCQADGVVAWNRYCGKGHCRAGIEVPNADCSL